jgi:xanthine dehydrogenase YagR molybdenum-binding subunit
MKETLIGKPLDRVDARAKVTGTATYAAEVPVANIAHAVIVGSLPARGTVMAVDVEAARRAAGVIAVLTKENAIALPDLNKKNGATDKILQALQDTELHYSDQPIALVIADTLERAQHAAWLVTATYAPGPAPVHDIAAAGVEKVKPPGGGPLGEPDSTRGDLVAGFAAAKLKVEGTYTTPIENHHPMEMHATTAVWQGDNALTVYDSTQGIFGVRNRLATIFGIPKENVRVIDHYVGGGFGSKGSPWSHVALAALAAKAIKRPVKLVVTRQQMCSLTGHRPKTIQQVSLGADARGMLTAIAHHVTSETSRFDLFVEPSALQTRMLYSCPNVATSHRVVKIDVPTPTFTRAPGESTGTYALEAAMDELAYACGVDPLELRLRNHAKTDEHEKKPYSSKSLLECYRRGAQAFGWSKRKMAPRSMSDGPLRVGWGLATATYPARQLPASARARMRLDGTLLVQAGTQDLGTGTYTIMTQIAADTLGMPMEKVTFELGDTELPETPLSAGSFTAASTGSAVKTVCLALRDELAKQAVAKGIPPLDYAAIVKQSGTPEIVVEKKNELAPHHENYSMHSFGAVFAEVKVDEELGIVRLTRLVGAYAAGKILNAKTARSQLIGGLVWSIGMALHEDTIRDGRTSRVVTRDLADYHIPVHADVPPIEAIMVDETDPFVNEVGAKGIGEIGNTGGAAAIANAVFHATGKRIRDLPIRLDKLMPEERA